MTDIVIRQLGLQAYEPVYQRMQQFNAARTAHTTDELWLLQHPPVFTMGLNAKPEHVLNAANVPVVHIDRGGQVTYHGPGQLIAYLLVDLKRNNLGVRQMVTSMEQAVIALLSTHAIDSTARSDAPGVYVEGSKVAALGLRIKRHSSYHGLSLNIDMDLRPFEQINPCGYEGLQVTQLRDLGVTDTVDSIEQQLMTHLLQEFGYTSHTLLTAFDD